MNKPKTVKLSANENFYGCSPLVLKAIKNKYREVHFYPEVNPLALKEKLADKFGVTPANIIVGAGSVRIIDGLIQTLVEPDEEVLTFEKSFMAYTLLSQFHRRKCIHAPVSDFRCVPENLLPFIHDKTRLIFIANPNNPTGTIISHNEFESFLGKISKNIVVAIDEAYSEYVTDKAYPNSLELQKKYPNLIIIHSFSKIYGLAGLRIGYAIMDEIKASKMVEGQIPYSLSCFSSDAAIAALSDSAFISQSAKANAEERVFLYEKLAELGYNALPTQANFIYLWFYTDAEKLEVYNALYIEGLVVCDMKVFGQEKSLRITLGDRKTSLKIVKCLS